ncbi:hypothetical protein [Lacinutrix sp. 5H-3-7-4]|uniref:hypothetical protein n=1 Tax=Lacinutrix sp. (strain 5H-3-7-4) TaxID=983544 RepID=UPI00020A3C1C|nr:hypothetical protein [Lacinutrix sp. 5H-3-7-4]AEH01980.1 hypothetical protein Lacal_2134 [Lacinutrix sp. 5H-3-7-4]
MKNDEVILMGYVIQDYLINENLQDVKPKNLMSLLIEKGFFNKDHRDGLPLRNVLRELYDKNLLYLIPQVSFEQKSKNRFWYFNPLQL